MRKKILFRMTNYFASKAKINVFCKYFEQRIFKERYIIRTILNYFPKVLKLRYYDKDNKYQIRKEKNPQNLMQSPSSQIFI